MAARPARPSSQAATRRSRRPTATPVGSDPLGAHFRPLRIFGLKPAKRSYLQTAGLIIDAKHREVARLVGVFSFKHESLVEYRRFFVFADLSSESTR